MTVRTHYDAIVLPGNRFIDDLVHVFLSSDEALARENEKMKKIRTCQICNDGTRDIVFLPCGHIAVCNECCIELKNCPTCSNAIKATVRILKPEWT